MLIIIRKIIPPRTPKAQEVAELGLRFRILREGFPGARTQVPRQKEAQFDRRPRPHQLDDGELADPSKAEAAPIESQMLGKTAFLVELMFE
jgi:hypothetical protein